MLIDSSKVWLLSLFVFINGLKKHNSEADWIPGIIKLLKTSAGVHQVVTLIDETGREDLHGSRETLLKAIETIPGRKIDFKEATIENARRLIQTSSFINAQTSLFITIQSQVDNQSQARLAKVHNFLSMLSKNRQRPKYLIVFFREENNQTYESLLRDLWSKKFLEATVLEIVKSRDEKKDFFLDLQQETARVYYFNPFTETLIRREASEIVRLFPDKLIDMHGYEMKVACVNRPPEVFINHKQSTHNVSGVMILKMKALSKAMKFSIAAMITDFGKISCSKNGSTDLNHILKNNEVHLALNEFGKYLECEDVLFEWATGIGNSNICLVVPILQDETNRLTTSWKVLNVIIVLCMPLILWIISRILRFQKRNWRPEYMVEIVFGFSVPQSPNNQAERLFFAAALFAYFLYSSTMYTALTSMNVSQKNATKFHNIDEVVNSELQILVTPFVFDLVFNTSSGSIRRLLNKSTKVYLTNQECLGRIINEKNVACIVSEDEVSMINRKEDSCGQPVTKIMDEYIKKTVSSTVLEPGSPFARKIEHQIQRLYQAGLVDKWWEYYKYKVSSKIIDSSISCTPHTLKLVLIISQLINLVSCGYACAILVFLLEIITPYLKKKLRDFRSST